MICSITNTIGTNSSFQTAPSYCSADTSPKKFPNVKVKNVKSSDLFLTNERVKLVVDLSLFEKIQEESHGGWNKKMNQIVGKALRVHRITEKGDVRVKFETEPNVRWTIYTFLLNRIECDFGIGDLVYVNKDERVAKHILDTNWNQNLSKFLGQIGQIVDIKSNGELLINSSDNSHFLICKELCYKITESKLSENYSGSNNLQDFTIK